MRIALFYHSLLSDWNHGNAHFLRGIVTELLERGHDVTVYEPENAWSLQNLRTEHGDAPLDAFRAAYPTLARPGVSVSYNLDTLDLDSVLAPTDLVLVHEWNDHALVAAIGQHHARNPHYALLFHDTHHRAVTERDSMAAYDLTHYDGVLTFGKVLRDLYLREGWTRRAWTWHEAADVRVFKPEGKGREGSGREWKGVEENKEEESDSVSSASPSDALSSSLPGGDLVWVGNWGDEERTAELHEFLLGPVKSLGLKAKVYGVRYPEHAKSALAEAGIEYGGWLPNFAAPEVFAQYKTTIHVPRRPYTQALPGIPTIRVFEALACGIPLVSAPWQDTEGLFTPGKDFLFAQSGDEMREHLKLLINEPERARELAAHGLQTIHARHTCAHRVRELETIYGELQAEKAGKEGQNSAAPNTQILMADAQGEVQGERVASPSPSHSISIAFFGSSLVSAYWNGAATYYRGILSALAARGHRITFYEPDAYERQQHRDIADPDYARVVVYPGEGETGVRQVLEAARGADLVVKASGVGVFDELLEAEVLKHKADGALVAFWDVDAPATLDRVHSDPNDPFLPLIPQYDLVLTYGGGEPVVSAYSALGAQLCVPIYNGLDPATHHPAPPDSRFEADLGFLGNRLPDREARVESFFLRAAELLPDKTFLLGGSGWGDKEMPPNVRYVGHVYTGDHNAFNTTPRAVLNISRESMARYGFSPATRVFEACGAGACLITDAWEGIETFLEPNREILVAANGEEVAALVRDLTPERAQQIGEAARTRVLAEHTYAHRAAQVEALLLERLSHAGRPK